MGARALALTVAAAAFALGQQAHAQRANENAVRSADDAFGASVGNERVGLYNDRDARGFSPIAAGNVRLEGMYFDMRSNVPSRLVAGTQVRVGLSAQSYPFPAPTGISDYTLRAVRDRNAVSTFVQAGPHDGYSLELDLEARVIPQQLGVSAGLFHRIEEAITDEQVTAWGLGVVSRWRPARGVEVTPFYGYGERLVDRATPYMFTTGAFLPPEIEARGFGQDWSGVDGHIEAYGVRATTPLTSNWTLNAGLFRHNNGSDGQIADLYLNVDRDGLAGVHRFTDEPINEQRSLSGEARLTGVWSGEDLRHTIHASFRGRESRRNFGGASVRNFGPAQVGVRTVMSQPAWTYGVSSFDEVTQYAGGLAYQLTWRGVGEASIGLQQIDYEKTVTTPGLAPVVTTDDPLIPNATLALTLSRRLALYASFTEGLEESPIAPEIAVNASETPPAIRTEQIDFGLRYAITPRLRLVAGYFDIVKPYFNLDGARVFRQLGDERHRGAEISLSGAATDRLNVVAGVVLMEPVVEGEAVNNGLIGDRPVGQTETTVRLNFDYRTPWVEGLSVDAALNYSGPRAATTRTFAELGGEQLMTESFTTLDLGMRYRFEIGGRHNTLRVQVTNVADAFAWQVLPSGALFVNNPRGIIATLATDF